MGRGAQLSFRGHFHSYFFTQSSDGNAVVDLCHGRISEEADLPRQALGGSTKRKVKRNLVNNGAVPFLGVNRPDGSSDEGKGGKGAVKK